MTYLDLIRNADRELDKGDITLGEYEEMIEPLKRDIDHTADVNKKVERTAETAQNVSGEDSISRKAAIANTVHMELFGRDYPVVPVSVLNSLPPAQPAADKYEYHYDHTDCIWFRPGERSRCPSTCAQYRDGWNDAMCYIYRDGKGYRPFRRGQSYE